MGTRITNGPTTTVYYDCALCSACTRRHTDLDPYKAELSAFKEAVDLGFVQLAERKDKERRRYELLICPHCAADVVAALAAPSQGKEPGR
jgi:hypothetical protein